MKKYNPNFIVKFSKYRVKEIFCSYSQQKYWRITITIEGTPIYPGHRVLLRYTLNNWETHHHIHAIWMMNRNNKEIWNAIIHHSDPSIKDIIEFAIMGYDCKNQLSWDNADGKNYTLFVKDFISGMIVDV